MKTNEITAENYQQAMPQVWNVVRGYCNDDEEAKNTITMAVENYIYDKQNGAGEYRALQCAMSELYIEEDYIMEFAEAMMSLNVEPAWDDDDNEEDDDEFSGLGALDQHVPFVCRI